MRSDGGVSGPFADLFALRETAPDQFVGPVLHEAWPAPYGGLLLGQACAAAARSIPDQRPLHALHGFFVRRGDPAAPLALTVERTSDTRRFMLRRVAATQGDALLMQMTASFQSPEPGWSHAATMPAVPAPEDLDSDRVRTFTALQDMPAAIGSPYDLMRAVDYRIALPAMASDDGAPTRAVWFRIAAEQPDDLRLHEAALAYMSDFSLIGPALLPHLSRSDWAGIAGCSLDHSLWIHAPFRCDDWLLYVQDSPWAGQARALARGAIFDRKGRLVASTAQEGLIRPLQASATHPTPST